MPEMSSQKVLNDSFDNFTRVCESTVLRLEFTSFNLGSSWGVAICSAWVSNLFEKLFVTFSVTAGTANVFGLPAFGETNHFILDRFYLYFSIFGGYAAASILKAVS